MSVVSAVTRDNTHRQAAAADECAEWLLWLKLERKAPVTREDYERTVAVLLKRNPATPFVDFTPQQVMDTIASYPPGTHRKVRAHLQSFFAWGVLTEHIDRNPLDRVPRMKRQPQHLIEVFTEAEIAALEALPIIDGCLFSLMFCLGLRKTECRNLQRKHVNLDRRECFVLNSKGGKSRVVEFGLDWSINQAVAELDFFERLNPDDHFWYTRPGGASVIGRRDPVGDGTFHRWYARCLNAAGVLYVPRSATNPGIHNPHTTRHTAITRLLRQGVSDSIVSKWAGHASVATTVDTYAHLTSADTRAVLDSVSF